MANILPNLLDKAIQSQRPLAVAYVRRLRTGHPDLAPAEVIARLERDYLAAVTSGGAAAGATAAAPGIGTAAAVALNVAEVGWFLETTVLYVLSLAEVYQLRATDPERLRTLLLVIITGNGMSGGVAKAAGRTGPHAALHIITKIPMGPIRVMNKILGKNFVAKYGTKQGVLVLGRELPLGLGAVIGAGGNAAIGHMTIRTARHIFGPPPDNWSRILAAA